MRNSILNNQFLIIVSILFLLSCEQVNDDVGIVLIESQTSNDLYCIDFEDGKYYIGGGHVWEVGILLSGTINDLQLDSITEKAIYGLSLTDDERIKLISADNHLYTKDGYWKPSRVSDQFILRTFDENDQFLIVGGGKTFEHGFIRSYDQDLQLVYQHQFLQQINRVEFISERHWMAVGYGSVYESFDNGSSWILRDDVYGDSFSDIHFLENRKVGYISGNQGDLLVTRDGGQTWKKELKGRISNGKSNHFNRIVSFDNHIWLLGERGRIAYKNDIGKWVSYKIDHDVDLYDGYALDEEKIIVVGENGFIAKLDFQ